MAETLAMRASERFTHKELLAEITQLRAERDEAQAHAVRLRDELVREQDRTLTLERERDEARADARRYRWLKQRNPDALATVAWCCKEACRYPDPDRAIDAAMKTLEAHEAVD